MWPRNIEKRWKIELKHLHIWQNYIHISGAYYVKASFVSNHVDNAYAKSNIRYKSLKYLVVLLKEEVKELDCSSKSII